MSGQPSKQFSDIELMRALYDVQDVLERALCPFVLLGETARSLKETAFLSGDGVYIGVLKKHITKESKSTIQIYLGKHEIREDGIDYDVNGVPVHVKFITKNYQFFKNQDFTFYMANEYKLPNPFETYWKARYLIQ